MGIYLGVKLLGHKGVCMDSIGKLWQDLLKWLYQTALLPAVCESSIYSVSSPIFHILSVFFSCLY